MKRIRDPKNLVYTPDALKISTEFDNLIKPFLDKYCFQYSPDELSMLMIDSIRIDVSGRIIEKRSAYRKKNPNKNTKIGEH